MKYTPRFISYAHEIIRQFDTAPKPVFKTKEPVTNYYYQGDAKRSHPRIQLYTIGPKDTYVYYKKLTKYQRNYASRLNKYESRVKSQALKNSTRSLMKSILKRSAWYSIPESLVINDWEWGQGVQIPVRSELDAHDIHPMTTMIQVALGNLESRDERDDIFLWNPTINSLDINYTIEASIEQVLSASQFSNTGALPLLEYYRRNRSYPLCVPLIGRERSPPFPIHKRRNIVYVSNFRHKVERKKKSQAVSSQVPCWGDNEEPAFENNDESIFEEYLKNFKVPEIPQEKDLGTDRNTDLDLGAIPGETVDAMSLAPSGNTEPAKPPPTTEKEHDRLFELLTVTERLDVGNVRDAGGSFGGVTCDSDDEPIDVDYLFE